MRILMVGAGAIGGYFGGRLLQAGRNVEFLVRARRAAELAKSGLVIKSPVGNATLPDPPTVLADDLVEVFDLIVLTCKAYDLDPCMTSIERAVGPGTMILPLLNGMRHIDRLVERFGSNCVLGGQCVIGATLNEQREVVHLSDLHTLTFGDLAGIRSSRILALAEVLGNAGFEVRSSTNILLDMWEKWIFLATLAGATCLMRAPIGHIVESPGGKKAILALFEECRAIAAAAGFAPRTDFVNRSLAMITAANSMLGSSMQRDIESGAAIEADHIAGDLLARRDPAQGDSQISMLEIVCTHLKAYEARRAHRLGASGS